MSQLMSLGMFVFSIPTLAYSKLQRQSQWRHASNSRVGARPAYQFAGPGDQTVTMAGTLAPGVAGDPRALDTLRDMADQGEAWPLVDGAGNVFGAFFIESLDEGERGFFADGVPRATDFTLSLKRADSGEDAGTAS